MNNQGQREGGQQIWEATCSHRGRRGPEEGPERVWLRGLEPGIRTEGRCSELGGGLGILPSVRRSGGQKPADGCWEAGSDPKGIFPSWSGWEAQVLAQEDARALSQLVLSLGPWKADRAMKN